MWDGFASKTAISTSNDIRNIIKANFEGGHIQDLKVVSFDFGSTHSFTNGSVRFAPYLVLLAHLPRVVIAVQVTGQCCRSWSFA